MSEVEHVGAVLGDAVAPAHGRVDVVHLRGDGHVGIPPLGAGLDALVQTLHRDERLQFVRRKDLQRVEAVEAAEVVERRARVLPVAVVETIRAARLPDAVDRVRGLAAARGRGAEVELLFVADVEAVLGTRPTLGRVEKEPRGQIVGLQIELGEVRARGLVVSLVLGIDENQRGVFHFAVEKAPTYLAALVRVVHY